MVSCMTSWIGGKQNLTSNQALVEGDDISFDDLGPFQSFFLLNHNPIIIINSHAKVVRLNPSAESIIGNATTIAGLPMVSFFSDIQQTYIAASLEKVLQGTAEKVEIELDCINDQRRYFRLKLIPALRETKHIIGAFCVLIDLTKEMLLLNALKKSEQYHRMITDNMTDLVSLMDAQGVIKYASASHLAVLGYQNERLVGSTLSNYLHPDDISQVRQQFLKMVQRRQQVKMECRIKHVSGDWLWLETHGSIAVNIDVSDGQYLLVSRNITERKALEQQLGFMAFHDSLTQLPNRRLFTDRLNQALLEHKRCGLSLAVLYIDLDKFKLINDSLGHDVGDELLVAFANRVKAVLRDMDTLARFGGDEFVILLPKLQAVDVAIQIVQRIMATLRQPWQLSNRMLKTTSSIGLALYPQHGYTAVELVKQADLALYQAKENGRNSYALASDITEQVVQQLSYSE